MGTIGAAMIMRGDDCRASGSMIAIERTFSGSTSLTTSPGLLATGFRVPPHDRANLIFVTMY